LDGALTKTVRVSVVIPTYNEVQSIGRVLADIPETVDEVLVVDSDSSDGTAAIEREGSQSLGGAAMAMKKEIFNMGMPWESGYGYSQAVKVGDTIYVSGQVDHDEAGKVLYPGDMERQMRQAYANDKRVLAHFGATMDNIVDEVFFVVERARPDRLCV